jgi:hypothetical protein
MCEQVRLDILRQGSIYRSNPSFNIIDIYLPLIAVSSTLPYSLRPSSPFLVRPVFGGGGGLRNLAP